jgi:hypothetical protein
LANFKLNKEDRKMNMLDPIVGKSRTKVGETYSTTSSKSDPIVGKSRTKIGETYTKTNSFATNSFGSSNYHYLPSTSYYSTPYYASSSRHYAPIRSGTVSSGIGSALVIGFLVVCVALIVGGSSRGRYHPGAGNTFFNPTSPLRERFWKCDIIEDCDVTLSGRKINCINIEESCRWVWK